VDGRESTALAIHRILFRGGAAVLENLDLRHAPAGDYHLTAFPVRIAGLDAAPVRAVLRPLGSS
jgi:arylformamidase